MSSLLETDTYKILYSVWQVNPIHAVRLKYVHVKKKVEAKFFPAFAMNAYMGSGDVAPLILNLGTR